MAFETVFSKYDRLVLFDTETTGLQYNRDEIIEFAAVVVQCRAGKPVIVQEYDELIALSPGGFVPPKITELTGINDDIRPNEYMLAFRISYDGDFHFVKRGNNGVWHHKRGSRDEIETMTILELLDESWIGRYDGPLVFFANTKK